MIRQFFLTLLFVTSCSTLPPGVTMKKIPAGDRREAKNIIQNQINFLKTIFEQTHDPYYNVPKWPEFCLKENVVGKLQDDETQLASLSDLYMRNNEPGFCSNNFPVERKYLLFYYCRSKEAVLELLIPHSSMTAFEITKICP